MSLPDLWKTNRGQLEGKHIRQIISFAGNGNLSDNSVTSAELRDFLSIIPTHYLLQYLDQCLNDKFDNNGFVLQDIVNQVGQRLGFSVKYGRYRGTPGRVGFDGLWAFPEGHKVVVEVKTTNVYQTSLDTLANYRRSLISDQLIIENESSILIIIGREDKDTSDLEAQIRGSRHSWNIRVLSVDALIKLLLLKERVDDPRIIQQISAIFIPKEFTKLDEIIDIVFIATEELEEVKEGHRDDDQESEDIRPASFSDECISRIEQKLEISIIKRSRTTYSSIDNVKRFSCAISRKYEKGSHIYFWFAFHTHQKEFLAGSDSSYAAFGCGSKDVLFLIPYRDFEQWLDGFNVTDSNNRLYWHVHINLIDNHYFIVRKKGFEKININHYLV